MRGSWRGRWALRKRKVTRFSIRYPQKKANTPISASSAGSPPRRFIALIAGDRIPNKNSLLCTHLKVPALQFIQSPMSRFTLRLWIMLSMPTQGTNAEATIQIANHPALRHTATAFPWAASAPNRSKNSGGQLHVVRRVSIS